MRNLKNSAAAMRPVKKEPFVMDLDNDHVFCGEVKEYMMDAEKTDTSTHSVAAKDDDDDDWDTKIDHRYMKVLDSYRDDGRSYLRDNPLLSIRYEVDNGGYDNREVKASTNNQRSREDQNTNCVIKKNVESKSHVQACTKKTTKEADFELRRRENIATEKNVEAMLITSHVRRNSQHNVKARKKENSEDQMVLDENCRSDLTWSVENSKCSRTNPEKEIQVKYEEYTMSLSDSDIIAVEDRPFLVEEDSPFVPSKNYKVVDLEEERDDGDQCSSWFRKEIMDILKQPYNEKEFLELNHEASLHRRLTRRRELRNGRELTYETDQKRPSYLDEYPDFKRKLKESLRRKDRHGALNLLRGFLFYLTKVVRHDAFKPWLDRECLKITFKQMSTSSSSAIKLEL